MGCDSLLGGFIVNEVSDAQGVFVVVICELEDFETIEQIGELLFPDFSFKSHF